MYRFIIDLSRFKANTFSITLVYFLKNIFVFSKKGLQIQIAIINEGEDIPKVNLKRSSINISKAVKILKILQVQDSPLLLRLSMAIEVKYGLNQIKVRGSLLNLFYRKGRIMIKRSKPLYHDSMLNLMVNLAPFVLSKSNEPSS